MIIVIMLMNMAMKMSNVWSARLSHSLWKCAAPPTHLRIKIRRPSQTNLSAAGKIRLLLRLKWHSCGALNGTFVALPLTQFELQPNFHMYIYIYVQYTYYQWVKHGLIFLKLCAASSSSSPLSKLSLLPAEAYSPPAQPRPNLNAVPHICTNMTLGCAF